jgi:RNA polymerase sigma factor (sigma-70 family)
VSNRKQDFVARLFGRYTGELVKYLTRRVQNRADARDLAQDAYVRLLRVDKVDLIRDPQAYLFRIASNLAYEYQLKQQQERAPLQAVPLDAELEHISNLTLEDETDLAARVTHLEAVLETLEPKHRAALVLHRQEGMTYEEIAACIGVSVHTVKKYISVGLTQCRARLARTGEES